MARWISPWARWSICGVWAGSAAAAYPNTSTNRCGKSENRPATFAGYRQGWTSVLQKDLPDLYVDLSTVGEGYAADHLARLMEQEGIARYLVSVGGALSSRGMNAQGSRGASRFRSRPTGKTQCRRLWISTGMASAPPAATVTITSWMASVSRTLSIRKRAPH